MKKFLFIIIRIKKLAIAHTQHAGIRINNPNRAKLEVHEVAGNGATIAIFCRFMLLLFSPKINSIHFKFQ